VTICDNRPGLTGEALGCIQADIEAATAPRQMNINERASKAEIISAAVELTDSQAHEIEVLTEQRNVLFALLGVLAVLQLF